MARQQLTVIEHVFPPQSLITVTVCEWEQRASACRSSKTQTPRATGKALDQDARRTLGPQRWEAAPRRLISDPRMGTHSQRENRNPPWPRGHPGRAVTLLLAAKSSGPREGPDTGGVMRGQGQSSAVLKREREQGESPGRLLRWPSVTWHRCSRWDSPLPTELALPGSSAGSGEIGPTSSRANRHQRPAGSVPSLSRLGGHEWGGVGGWVGGRGLTRGQAGPSPFPQSPGLWRRWAREGVRNQVHLLTHYCQTLDKAAQAPCGRDHVQLQQECQTLQTETEHAQ